MRFSYLDFRSKLLKIAVKDVPAILRRIMVSFNMLLFKDQDVISNKDGLEYWKSQIFSILSLLMIIFGAPLLFFGAYMFYLHGQPIQAIIEVVSYFIITIVITQKSLSVVFRKFFVVFAIYLISILLLVSAGVMGAGLVCVAFSLILAGCLLDKRRVFQVVTINIIFFITITILLKYGYFDGTYMGAYGDAWPINVATTQLFGIGCLFLMNTIYTGLDNQTQLIKKSKESLAASEAKHKAMIANISDVIAILDAKGVFKYFSPNMEQRYGWTTKDLSNKPIWEVIHTDDRDGIKGEFQGLNEIAGLEKTLEARYLCKDGRVRHIELTAVNLTKDHNIKGILMNFHDITEHKIREEKILHLNYHDVLTGLYNRTFFEEEKLRLDTESYLPLSVIIGDINGLKIINDSLGHVEGDRLLVAIARALAGCCRKEDILARIGGDEFSILLPRTSGEAAYEIIKRINSACEAYNKKSSNELHYTSISLGSATRTSMEESLDSILKIAEDYMYQRKLLEARSLHSSIISSMKTALFEKSQQTEEHAGRLVKLSRAIGETIGLAEQQLDELELFSTLHDIGKIGIDEQILNKPGKLTASEWVEMKKHSEVGYRIAISSPELMPIADYILTHHEHWDGSGYPQGLIGEDIPLFSRIIAVVDAYDAMTEDRPYRKAMHQEAAINEIIKNSGTQFDPVIAKIFVEIISKLDQN